MRQPARCVTDALAVEDGAIGEMESEDTKLSVLFEGEGVGHSIGRWRRSAKRVKSNSVGEVAGFWLSNIWVWMLRSGA